MNRIAILTVATFVVLLAGCSNPPAKPSITLATHPSIAEIATNYTSYQAVTHKAVYVNLELAMLCRGANQADVEAARIKHGPHANTAILVYMNDSAAQAFSKGSNAYPVGAIIVKHKSILGYTDPKSDQVVRSADNGVGGMVKRTAGFDPPNGDWEYFYFENPSKIESGHINSCIQCHAGAKSTDYVFGTWPRN